MSAGRVNESRRRFLYGASAAAVSSALCPSMLLAQGRRRVPVLQSWTEGGESFIVVLGRKDWRFELAWGPGRLASAMQAPLDLGDRCLWHLHLRGLSTSSPSQLAIKDAAGLIVETRVLKGLNPELVRPKIATISCSNYRNVSGQEKIWSQVVAQGADMIFFVGDIVYANSKWRSVTGEAEPLGSAMARYVETWDAVDLYALDPLVPVMAVWDDHDYGMNNGDGTHPHRQEMQRIFRSFYPVPRRTSARFLPGLGVGFRWSMFGVDFYGLDGRSFRQEGRTQWGSAQEEWLEQDYRRGQGAAVLANGTSFLAYTRFIESVERQGGSSFSFLRSLIRSRKRPTVLVSGDVHASQVQLLSEDVFGHATMEITSSAIHSSSAGPLHFRGRGRGQVFYEGSSNFMGLMLSGAAQDPLSIAIQCATPTEIKAVHQMRVQA